MVAELSYPLVIVAGMGIDAVIFDWGGTLTPWHDMDLRQAWASYARAYGADADLPAMVEALLAAEDEAWRVSRDEHRSTRFADIVTAAGLDADGDAHQRGLVAYQDWFEPHTYLDPDAPKLFNGLAERGVRIGVLSNTTWARARHEEIFRRDGVLEFIDGAVYSSEIPYTKPHPGAFGAAMDAVEVTEPGRCVFVGDRPFDDVHGAKDVGMRAVLVPHSNIPDWQRGHTDGTPDAVIKRLGDLLPVVDSWRAG